MSPELQRVLEFVASSGTGAVVTHQVACVSLRSEDWTVQERRAYARAAARLKRLVELGHLVRITDPHTTGWYRIAV